MNKRVYNALRKQAGIDWSGVTDYAVPAGSGLLAYLVARGLGAGQGLSATLGLGAGALGWGGRHLYKKYLKDKSKQPTPKAMPEIAAIGSEDKDGYFDNSDRRLEADMPQAEAEARREIATRGKAALDRILYSVARPEVRDLVPGASMDRDLVRESTRQWLQQRREDELMQAAQDLQIPPNGNLR